MHARVDNFRSDVDAASTTKTDDWGPEEAAGFTADNTADVPTVMNLHDRSLLDPINDAMAGRRVGAAPPEKHHGHPGRGQGGLSAVPRVPPSSSIKNLDSASADDVLNTSMAMLARFAEATAAHTRAVGGGERALSVSHRSSLTESVSLSVSSNASPTEQPPSAFSSETMGRPALSNTATPHHSTDRSSARVGHRETAEFSSTEVLEGVTAGRPSAASRSSVPRTNFAKLVIETSVRNHDFTKILSSEEKAALTHNMQPCEEDEEDAGDVVCTPPSLPHHSWSAARPSLLSLAERERGEQRRPDEAEKKLVPVQAWRFPSLGCAQPLTGGGGPGVARQPTLRVPGDPVAHASETSVSTPVDEVAASTEAVPNARGHPPVASPGSNHFQDSCGVAGAARAMRGWWEPNPRKAAADGASNEAIRKRSEVAGPGTAADATSTSDSSANAAHTARLTPAATAAGEVGLTGEESVVLDADPAYRRALERVYGVYERQYGEHTASSHARSDSNSGREQSQYARPSAHSCVDLPHARRWSDMLSLSCSGPLGRSAGYYSFGSHASLSHPNRQSIPFRPPYLKSSSSVRSLRDARRSLRSVLQPEQPSFQAQLHQDHRCRMNPALLQRIMRRPLLQTTIFLKHTYASIRAEVRRSRRASSTRLAALGAEADADQLATNNASLQEKGSGAFAVSHRQVPASSPFSADDGATAAAVADQCESSPTDAVAAEPCFERAKEQPCTPLSAVQPMEPVMSLPESPMVPLTYHRELTPHTKLLRHVHPLDGIEREVDNENDDLVVFVGTRLMGWLEVVSLLGCGSFGQVFLCKDLRICDGCFTHPSEIAGDDFSYWNCSHAYLPFGDCSVPPTSPPLVAVKVVKSVPLLERQSVLEAEMLVLIGAQTALSESDAASAATGGVAAPDEAYAALGGDPPRADPRSEYVAKALADGTCYGHHCIVMERYGANLFEYVQSTSHRGLPMYQIQSIGRQLCAALSLLHEQCHIIHADIKPENMLLTLDSCRSTIATTFNQATASSATEAVAHATAPHESPHRHTRRESGLPAASAESSYITLHASSGASHGASRRASDNYHEDPVSSLPAPEPRRVHAMNQPTRQDSVALGASAVDTPATAPPSLRVKLIDFSSSCYDGGPFYSYIQSRYYRAPEVIVHAPYGAPIDMWSTGCLLAELLLGIPLLPGCNHHHQLQLIEEMVGPVAPSVLATGVSTDSFFAKHSGPPPDPSTTAARPVGDQQLCDEASPAASYTLRTKEDYLRLHDLPPVDYVRYFTYSTLQELVRHCPLTLEECRMSSGLPPYVPPSEPSEVPAGATPSPQVRAEMLKQRFLLFDLLRHLLRTNPAERLTAAQALAHPFFQNSPPYMKHFGLS